MGPGFERWNVANASDWARVLGLVPVPLFGKASSADRQSGSVLLDGQKSSFTFIVTDEPVELLNNRPLEWSWSSFFESHDHRGREEGASSAPQVGLARDNP